MMSTGRRLVSLWNLIFRKFSLVCLDISGGIERRILTKIEFIHTFVFVYFINKHLPNEFVCYVSYRGQ